MHQSYEILMVHNNSTDRSAAIAASFPRVTGLHLTGVIPADQIKSVDWRTRRAEFIARCPKDAFDQIQAKVRVLLAL